MSKRKSLSVFRGFTAPVLSLFLDFLLPIQRLGKVKRPEAFMLFVDCETLHPFRMLDFLALAEVPHLPPKLYVFDIA
jgi:hypothetical protein